METVKYPSTDEWIKRVWFVHVCIHTHTHTHIYTIYTYIYAIFIHIYIYQIYVMEYYSAIKKNEILPFATTWMEKNCIIIKSCRKSI